MALSPSSASEPGVGEVIFPREATKHGPVPIPGLRSPSDCGVGLTTQDFAAGDGSLNPEWVLASGRPMDCPRQ